MPMPKAVQINTTHLDTLNWSRMCVAFGLKLDDGKEKAYSELTQTELQILHLLLTRDLKPLGISGSIADQYPGLATMAAFAKAASEWAAQHMPDPPEVVDPDAKNINVLHFKKPGSQP
jgi:Cu/Ag efflux protein CusF